MIVGGSPAIGSIDGGAQRDISTTPTHMTKSEHSTDQSGNSAVEALAEDQHPEDDVANGSTISSAG